LVKILQNETLLKKYNENRIAACDRKIADLKKTAIVWMGGLRNPEEMPFKVPKPQTFRDYFVREEELWTQFDWNLFFNSDFIKLKKENPKARKVDCEKLEEVRVQLSFLLHQKEILGKKVGEERLDCIKKIAQFSFVKHEFIKNRALDWVKFSLCFIIPSGPFWAEYFQIFSKEDLLYTGKKECLLPNLQKYDNFIGAHNKLIEENDFLVPYMTKLKDV
jgi:hypothetical protein